MNQFFVGFGQIEVLLNSHQREAPVYVQLCCETHGSGTPGYHVQEQVIVVSDVQDGVCRYWRKRLSRTELIGGRPFHEAEAKLHVEFAGKVRAAVEKQIVEVYRYRFLEAVVAAPRDLKLLDGEADFLRFDREARSYVPAT